MATSLFRTALKGGLHKNYLRKTLRSSFNLEKILCIHTSSLLNVKGQEINMPSLSPTMTEGNIVKWLKKEGDKISAGDVLCEIQTDKAVMSFETEEEGVLAKILIPEDTKEIKVGSLIALMVAEGEDWKSVEIPDAKGVAPAASNAQEEPEESEQSTGGNTPGIELTMPSLSPTMSEGTIIKWHKQPGDKVSAGDVLCDIQTDKAVMSFETEEEGTLAKILLGDDSKDVKVGDLIALMVAEGEDWNDVKVPGKKKTKSSVAKEEDVQKPKVESQTSLEPTTRYSYDGYSPAVRSLLELYAIDGSTIKGTGKQGKLLKGDVLKHVTEKQLSIKPPRTGETSSLKSVTPTIVSRPTKGPSYVDIPLTGMRLTIAKRLTESKTMIPHAYATAESNIDSLLGLRKQLKLAGINVSVNDFIIKAVAIALKQCPLVNCHYVKDKVVLQQTSDISVAVATEAGLITPIVTDADGKALDEISAEIKELAGRARIGKLQLHEFQGGSFTISNLGMFDISEFSAIINPPQCGILAVGSGRPIIGLNGKPQTIMTATLSYDSRAISESAASDFLETLQGLLQMPASLLLTSPAAKKRVSN
ncbi:dihydrolipoyllysine-residue acetyltransferase component 1 of pyruvate dehydrogenase complex, mitochondrial-like isoform X2 [Rhopalosiphum maidis]|uniref:dihydrolipoyllysine-residue acetyltransferase component 1 of pyruvate dehydrogenase complex, mitochondrial-like isoform X2 n=1 Tax=Rhopalosiphum maidis TaxID=43146 RepID=UPI000F0027F4|nr:dihydrolipoyllysine-residue acetyltransferase component 1 of pyruvate dehydrogenase complex, mitochondrial-like isoform X2 [Rhopalosiphum maidis]